MDFADFEYALTNPPAPNFIPPKYLVTTIAELVNSSFFISSKIGIPAVPDGSPSSEYFCAFFFSPRMYAETLWVASLFFFLISLINVNASSSVSTCLL